LQNEVLLAITQQHQNVQNSTKNRSPSIMVRSLLGAVITLDGILRK